MFAGDLPFGDDALGIEIAIGHLAELAAHRGTATPLCVGLLGGAGSGKSFALRRLTARVNDLATAAEETQHSPFLTRIHIQPIDAARLEGEPSLALAGQLHAGLLQPYPELAREIANTVRDPHVAVRETNERLDEARRRLDMERRTLDESGSRLARLTETVLYDATGSQVDSYARAHRAGLENRLTSFGFRGDPIQTYKDLVRFVAESGPAGLSVRAVYAFKGQTRLLVMAALLVALAVGLGIAVETQDSWLASLATGPQAVASGATWMTAHMDVLVLARKAAFVLAGLALAANLWRAVSFVKPVLTGARLFKTDLAARRRDLDGLYAHQTKRVDGLAADVERLTQASLEAEKRLGASSGTSGLSDPSPFEADARTQAHAIFLALGLSLADTRSRRPGTVPQRIVLAIDHLETVAPDQARRILETLHRLASASGVVSLVALDASRLGSTQQDLDRWVQLPLRLDARSEHSDLRALVLQTLGHAPVQAPPGKVDAARSVLDVPIEDGEATLLAALAPLAGSSPRAVKRFVNVYTLARLETDVQRGALALMLALDQGGTQAERRAAEEAMTGEGPDAAFEPRPSSARFRAALDGVEAANGRVSKADVAKAAARATLYSTTAPV